MEDVDNPSRLLIFVEANLSAFLFRELLQHMVVHGVSQDEEFVQKTVMIKVTSPITSPPATPAPSAVVVTAETSSRPGTPPSNSASQSPSPTKVSDSEADGAVSLAYSFFFVGSVLDVHFFLQSPNKRYSCSSCPYVSNSKSQFLYHKQFHRSRGAVFKCSLCSYNVSRRHLLHQHLKVHGVSVPPQKTSGDKESSLASEVSLSFVFDLFDWQPCEGGKAIVGSVQ